MLYRCIIYSVYYKKNDRVYTSAIETHKRDMTSIII